MKKISYFLLIGIFSTLSICACSSHENNSSYDGREFDISIKQDKSLILKSEHNSSFEVLPVWIQVNDRTRLLRSLDREKNPNYEEICRRFLADKKDFSNLDFNYEVFLNDKDNFSNILNRPKINKFLKDEIN